MKKLSTSLRIKPDQHKKADTVFKNNIEFSSLNHLYEQAIKLLLDKYNEKGEKKQ